MKVRELSGNAAIRGKNNPNTSTSQANSENISFLNTSEDQVPNAT